MLRSILARDLLLHSLSLGGMGKGWKMAERGVAGSAQLRSGSWGCQTIAIEPLVEDLCLKVNDGALSLLVVEDSSPASVSTSGLSDA